jgi:dolichol-phosphate mannosyltransferase
MLLVFFMEIHNHLFILKIRNSAGKELIQYSLVGISGFLINLGVLYFLTEFFGLYYLSSALFAGIFGGSYCFIVAKIWIFQEDFSSHFFKEYSTYFLIGGISMVLKLALLYFLTDIVGIYYLFSQVISLTFFGVFTFICNEIWTFTARRKNLRN